MQIILKQDVVNLGYKDDIVTVKDGYANNYLLPQGMAIMATPANKKMHEETLRQRAFKEEKIRKDAETLKAALDGKNVRLATKVGENGQLFGSINNIQIADALKAQYNYDVDRKKIVVDGSKIKEVGTYNAVVNIYRDIKATLNLEVVNEEAPAEAAPEA
ncbi:MAG: 50S ribosomal protein L9 [Bacteroidales bacterium]|nr:50S ribosomal protein L9 [Bacteroidales bacterium]MBP5326866.1 50S ribosomal protein L9 [Bacteroidales bacterium]MCR5193725.1 50S ribosomal protein L9 [Bacteroidales bacterium]